MPFNTQSLRSQARLTSLRQFGQLSIPITILLLNIFVATSARADSALVPVRIWCSGTILNLKFSALGNEVETYAPLEALPGLGIKSNPQVSGDSMKIKMPNGAIEILGLSAFHGRKMFALSQLGFLMNASVERPGRLPDFKPESGYSDPNTVYYLARITTTRFMNGNLHITTSFPVSFHSRMLDNERPPRGYVDCVGATADNDLQIQAAPSDKRILSLRIGQNNPGTARVVVQFASKSMLLSGDSKNASANYVVGAKYSGVPMSRLAGNQAPSRSDRTAKATRPFPDRIANSRKTSEVTPDVSVQNHSTGSKADTPDGQTVSTRQNTAQNAPPVTPPAGDNSDSGTVQDTKPSIIGRLPSRSGSNIQRALPAGFKPPISLSTISLNEVDKNQVRLYIGTSGRVSPEIRYIAGTTKMVMILPNTILQTSDSDYAEQSFTHPLISGIHAETIAGKTPTTRLTIDTTRIVGFTPTVDGDHITLELRLPRNATGVLADKLIVVDAGHGGNDLGATMYGVQEKDITLSIALKLRDQLEEAGAKVIMTRSEDATLVLESRPRLANTVGAQLFIAIHNDDASNHSASGTSTYYHMRDPSSRALAACIQNSIVAVSGLPNRGVLSDSVRFASSGFAVLRYSTMPAILCEVAYISNDNDRKHLVNQDFQQRVATAIRDGIKNYVEGSP